MAADIRNPTMASTFSTVQTDGQINDIEVMTRHASWLAMLSTAMLGAEIGKRAGIKLD